MFKNTAVQTAIIAAIVGPLLLALFNAFVKPGLIDTTKETISAVGISEETMRHKNRSIVMIENDQNELATGFFVSPSLIVTAERIARDSGSVRVIRDIQGGSPDTIRCNVKDHNAQYNYAIIDFGHRTDPTLALEIKNKAPENLDKVFTIGYAIERYWMVRDGRIIQSNYYDETTGIILYSADIGVLPGMTGSPVFDKNGKVIGMVSKSILNADIAFVIPILKIQQSVEKLGGSQ
jgi:V8-like Glu-specific endopeptidase